MRHILQSIILIVAMACMPAVVSAQKPIAKPDFSKKNTTSSSTSKSSSNSTSAKSSSTAKKGSASAATGTIAGHEYVDLGLPSGLLWATCNVGASNPEEYGNHYAWGETSTKSSYNDDNCETWDKNIGDIGGTSRDVARVKWGSPWRMPTRAEFDELLDSDNCTWTWTTQGGHNGYKVTSRKNGNSIFLPAAGWRGSSLYNSGCSGEYWSSNGSNIRSAYYLSFGSGDHYTDWRGRTSGHTIRPVAGTTSNSLNSSTTPSSSTISVASTINGHEYVDLGLSVKWATMNVGASSPEGEGNFYAWGETDKKPSYSQANSKTYNRNFGDIAGYSTYDAARANWGGTWRLPTKMECQELVDNCDWYWTTQNRVAGYKVTSRKNGKSIFLPAAGGCFGTSPGDVAKCGYYWSSTPYEGDTKHAYHLDFSSDNLGVKACFRDFGYSVRPVAE